METIKQLVANSGMKIIMFMKLARKCYELLAHLESKRHQCMGTSVCAIGGTRLWVISVPSYNPGSAGHPDSVGLLGCPDGMCSVGMWPGILYATRKTKAAFVMGLVGIVNVSC